MSLFDLVAGLVDLPFTALQRGTYGIASTYSEPEIYVHSRRDTIQLVAHPATYDRAYVSLLASTTRAHGLRVQLYSQLN